MIKSKLFTRVFGGDFSTFFNRNVFLRIVFNINNICIQ